MTREVTTSEEVRTRERMLRDGLMVYIRQRRQSTSTDIRTLAPSRHIPSQDALALPSATSPPPQPDTSLGYTVNLHSLAYFNLLLLTLLNASASASDFVCSTDDIAATGCLGPKDCLYSDPDSCNTFIQCTVNSDGITGTPVVRDCPSGLEWNDDAKECAYPEDSTCPTTGIASAFVCPAEDIAATGCRGPKDCLYPYAGSCNKFIQCVVNKDGTTATPKIVNCPPSTPPLVWNDNLKECVPPGHGTCPKSAFVIQAGEL